MPSFPQRLSQVITEAQWTALKNSGRRKLSDAVRAIDEVAVSGGPLAEAEAIRSAEALAASMLRAANTQPKGLPADSIPGFPGAAVRQPPLPRAPQAEPHQSPWLLMPGVLPQAPSDFIGGVAPLPRPSSAPTASSPPGVIAPVPPDAPLITMLPGMDAYMDAYDSVDGWQLPPQQPQLPLPTKAMKTSLCVACNIWFGQFNFSKKERRRKDEWRCRQCVDVLRLELEAEAEAKLANVAAVSSSETIESQIVAMGFDADQVRQALADSDVGRDPEKAVAFLLAQFSDGHMNRNSEGPEILKQDQMELFQWRSGERRFIPEIIDVDSDMVESGAMIVAPNVTAEASSKRPLEASEMSNTSSSLSRQVRIKMEKVEMQTKMSEKEKECERLEDENDILTDTLQPMTTTVNALQTKVDALYCIASALVPDDHRDSLSKLDVKKQDAAPQIVEYTCSLLASLAPGQVSKAARSLSIDVKGLDQAEVIQKLQEALGGMGPQA